MRNSLRTRLLSPRLVSGLLLALVYVAPQQAAQSAAPATQACTVSGVVQSGAVVLPGVSVAALGPDGTEIAATSTEQNGSYVLKLTGPGRDQLRRAAYSIGLNLAEGRGSRSRKQQRRFFDIAMASLRECQAVLVIEGLENTEVGKTADQLGAAVYSLIRNML